MAFDFTKRLTKARRKEFAEIIKDLQEQMGGIKISSRGWCYVMEGERYINKNQFDKVEEAINQCRKEGLLPVDLVEEDAGRLFSGVEHPTNMTIDHLVRDGLLWVLEGYDRFTPDWWEGEQYYIQVVVEKVDLKTFFEPVCRQYHIPIANSRGWSSILQRATYAKRFAEAEDMGLQPVLLYCGDHDPDGLRISDVMRENLDQIKDIRWSSGRSGYDPSNLIIDRIGLNFDFIEQNGLMWIDNLITGNKSKDMSLADPRHPNFKLPYVQDYLRKVGVRKCEANAIVTRPGAAVSLITEAIQKYLGEDALARFSKKEKAVKKEYLQILSETGIEEPIREYLDLPKRDDEDDEDEEDDNEFF